MILAVDFGTTYTVAATADAGRVALVDGDDGSSRMPSAVWLDDRGELIVGAAAVRHSVIAPDRFEATPKRLVGDDHVLLGERLLAIQEVIAAVIARVADEAKRKHGGYAPDEVRITHPATWQEFRCDVLRAAARAAGLPEPELMAEPVAAAIRIGGDRVAVGQHVGVYDFGGGTFDAAVMRRTGSGFEVVGQPGGRDPLGGEDIDQRIIDYLAEGPVGQDPNWELLVHPPDETWRRHRADLRTKVRDAKEDLSRTTVVDMWIPGLERRVQLARAELEDLIRGDIDSTVQIMGDTISAAGLGADQLAGIFLVGGSSRIPLVAETLWRAFGRKPDVEGDPKAVVALGAAAWEGTAAPAPARRFRSRVAMARTVRLVWTGSSEGRASLTASGNEGLVRVMEAPATVPDAAALADAALVSWQRASGFEERACVTTTVLGRKDGIERLLIADHMGSGIRWLERYAVLDDRAVVITAHQAVRRVADDVQPVRPALDPQQYYEPCFSLGVPADWTVFERVELVRSGSGHRVMVESVPLEAGMTTERWAQQVVRESSVPDTTIVDGPARARVFGQAGGIVYTRARVDGTLTRHWMLASHGRGYTISVSLPRHESLGFPLFVRHARLRPSEAPAVVAEPAAVAGSVDDRLAPG